MTSYPRVTVLAMDETVLRESPIFAALACQWLENGRFVPGTATQDRPLAVVAFSPTAPAWTLRTPTLGIPAEPAPSLVARAVLPELVPVARGARRRVSSEVERP